MPQVQRLMESPEAAGLCREYRRDQVVDALRAELARMRDAILARRPVDDDAGSPAFFRRVLDALRATRQPSLRRVINATGVVLHTNLGRAPLPQEALAAIAGLAAGYCNLEFDLDGGQRGSRYDHVEALICRLTGAEAALVVNNCAAAVLLALTALARDGEVIASRGELIEIGGSFRMPDVIAQSGACLVEVGATNKTRLSDYAAAITPKTRVILKSHTSNYRIVGFSAQPERAALARLADEHGLVFMEDLGSGTFVDLRPFGLPEEPTVQQCLREGAGLLAFSGDKLLGGPQAGILAGRRDDIARLKKHPLLRALRIDKLSLAALEAVLRLHDLPAPERRLPVLDMLGAPPEALAARARRLARRLRAIPGLQVRIRR
ncbi:L-seryl-tRNA(Sec) selenium transferase, partial [Noviherbaspirillum sp. 17J57-3]|nr:L-seryl-tRNA(Sec) selenium transferase [Noviherbaspirillum galbum]